jgi:hypothetical protein
MNDSFGIGGIKRAGHLHANIAQFIEWQRAVGKPVLQRLATWKFQHQEHLPLIFVNGLKDADGGMMEGRSGPRLAAEAVQSAIVVKSFVGQES